MQSVLFLFLFFSFVISDVEHKIGWVTYSEKPTPNLLYAFDYLKFDFPSVRDRDSYIKNETYKNCLLGGVKVSHSGDFYVSIPRWKPNVPATIAKIIQRDGETLLEPFPSWELNEVGNEDAFQSVTGFEIDSRDWLWIVDQGKVDSPVAARGSIKLVIYDLTTNPPTLVRRYRFPENVAPLDSSFLEDIVVDEANNFAYITDSGRSTIHSIDSLRSGIVVYDFSANTSRSVLDRDATTQPDSAVWISVNQELVFVTRPMNAGIDGIALCVPSDGSDPLVYYSPLTSRKLYSIPSSVLRNSSINSTTLTKSVKLLGNKGSASEGMGCGNNGLLYMTMVEENSVAAFDGSTLLTISRNDTNIIWPYRIAFDHASNLIFVSNKLYNFIQDKLEFNANETNYRIWSVYIGADSYLDSVPSSSSGTIEMVFYYGLIIGAAILAVFTGCFIAYLQANKNMLKSLFIQHPSSHHDVNRTPYHDVEEEGNTEAKDPPTPE